jgi:hypothetical protein
MQSAWIRGRNVASRAAARLLRCRSIAHRERPYVDSQRANSSVAPGSNAHTVDKTLASRPRFRRPIALTSGSAGMSLSILFATVRRNFNRSRRASQSHLLRSRAYRHPMPCANRGRTLETGRLLFATEALGCGQLGTASRPSTTLSRRLSPAVLRRSSSNSKRRTRPGRAKARTPIDKLNILAGRARGPCRHCSSRPTS